MESLKQWKPETFDIASFKWHLSERKNKEIMGNFLLVKNIIAEEMIVAIINEIVARYIEC